MPEHKEIWELKEAAKWSLNADEKKSAIRELRSKGKEALPPLTEILEVTAYEEIKTACIDAIKEIVEEEKSVMIKKS